MTMPAGWKPDPVKAALGEEKFLWKHELTKGFFRQHVVGMLAVTNQRVMAPGAAIQLQEIDAVVVRNKREVTKHSGTMKLRPAGRRYGRDEIKIDTESKVIGDVAFIRDGVPVIVFENLPDPDYLAGIATAARDHVRGIIGRGAKDEGGESVVCAQCGSDNPANSKFCNSCGHSFASSCPKCGGESPRGSAFCGHCGAALSQ